MTSRRITYAIILLAVLAVFIMTDNDVALFLFVALAVIPFIFLIQLSIAMRRVKFDFGASSSCIRGKPLTITAKIGLAPRFLAGAAKVVLEIENTTFHTVEQRILLYNDLSFTPYDYKYFSDNSGRLVIKIKEIKLLDFFGLCSITVKSSSYEEAIVAPVLYDEMIVKLADNAQSMVSGERVLPQKGNDNTEIFDIRDYRDGDALKSIHWKLSGKFDTLKTKEFSATEDNHALILIDMSRKKWEYEATDKQLNCILDAAISISGALCADGFVHSVGWFGDGEFCHSQVNDAESLLAMTSALMSVKVAEENAETLEFYFRTEMSRIFQKVIFITSSVRPEEWKTLENSFVTAVAINDDENGEVYDGGAKVINVPCDGFVEYISAYRL